MQVTLLRAENLALLANTSTSASSPLRPTRPDFASLPGPITILRQTLATHGFRGLWLGHYGTLLRETGGSSAWFTTFEVVSRMFMRSREKSTGAARGSIGRSDLKAWELCVAGGCSGMAYNSESLRQWGLIARAPGTELTFVSFWCQSSSSPPTRSNLPSRQTPSSVRTLLHPIGRRSWGPRRRSLRRGGSRGFMLGASFPRFPLSSSLVLSSFLH